MPITEYFKSCKKRARGDAWKAVAASSARSSPTAGTKERTEACSDNTGLLSLGKALQLARKPDDESVPVRHAHLRQRLGVHRVVLADYFLTNFLTVIPAV